MAWRTPTEADLLTQISGPELEAFREAALADGQDDPIAAQILNQVRLMRSYVFRCRFNSPKNIGGGSAEAADTIPESLIATFLDLIVPVIQRRAAGITIESDDSRSSPRRDALRHLERVAKCEVEIDHTCPVTVCDQPDALPPSPSFSGRARTAGRANYDG